MQSERPQDTISFVSVPQFVKRSSLCRASVYNMIERGELPKLVRISQGRVGFVKDEIEAWFEQRVAAR